MRLLPLPALLAAALASSACGGGGGGESGPVTVTLLSVEALNGSVNSTGYRTPSYVAAGDRTPPGSAEIHFRGFLSFDLAPLPPGATVSTATLTLHQVRVFGTPYASLGQLLLDQVVFGSVLEAGAYDRTFPTSQGFATIATDATIGPRTIVATAEVQADVAAGRAYSQYRIRFGLEGDGDMSADQADIGGPGNSSPDTHPTLVVTYRR